MLRKCCGYSCLPLTKLTFLESDFLHVDLFLKKIQTCQLKTNHCHHNNSVKKVIEFYFSLFLPFLQKLQHVSFFFLFLTFTSCLLY